MQVRTPLTVITEKLGRWDLEQFEQEGTELVFIGKQVRERKEEILGRLTLCEQ